MMTIEKNCKINKPNYGCICEDEDVFVHADGSITSWSVVSLWKDSANTTAVSRGAESGQLALRR